MSNRNLIILLCALFLAGSSSCYYHHRHHNDVSVRIDESEDSYRMSARFDEDKTDLVQDYISGHTGHNGLFGHGGHIEMDAGATYGDNINVYIRFHPGRLKIELDKDENSAAACHEIKELCEGIKDMLAGN